MICLNCGRTLKNLQSKEIGYGPACYKKIYGSSIPIRSRDRPITEKFPYYDIPGQISWNDYLQMLTAE